MFCFGSKGFTSSVFRCFRGVSFILFFVRILKEAMIWSVVFVLVVFFDMKSMNVWKVTRSLWLGLIMFMMRLNSASFCGVGVG